MQRRKYGSNIWKISFQFKSKLVLDSFWNTEKCAVGVGCVRSGSGIVKYS